MDNFFRILGRLDEKKNEIAAWIEAGYWIAVFVMEGRVKEE